MIFNLFKNNKKWQHKDKNIRIASVNEILKLDDPIQNDILISLLNEDESELVRRAVLLKMDNIETYLNASIYNDDEKIKLFAKKKVKSMLVDQSEHSISTQDKQNLIKSDGIDDLTLLEYWLTHEQNSDLICALYEKISIKKTNHSFLLNVFSTKQNEQVQIFLLKDVSETNLLTKIFKKSVNKNVSAIIEQKINANKEAVEKPIKLEKQLQLLLSKLLALKDVSDYGLYVQRKSPLTDSWETGVKDFSCLPQEKQTLFFDKFTSINKQLDNIFSSKESAYLSELEKQSIAEELEKTKQGFQLQLNEFQKRLSVVISKSDLIEATKLSTEIELVKAQVVKSSLDKNTQQQMVNDFSTAIVQVSKLPEIVNAISQAKDLIETFKLVSIPQALDECESAQAELKKWQLSWQQITVSACGELPADIKSQFEALTNAWHLVLKPLKRQQKENLTAVKQKLQDIKRLLLNGKFKVCFGLFKGVKQDVTALTEYQLQQVQRDFDFVSEKMAEVSDWEQYIATPKKQALLTEIQALVIAPLDNPNEQATKVKAFRKTWNTLGHAEASLDKLLNDEFNNACEDAFAPCRLFYAEQEKVRINNLAVRQKLVTEIKALAAPFVKIADDKASFNEEGTEVIQSHSDRGVDFKALDIKVNQLFKDWQLAGDVDKTQYQQLLVEFKTSQNIIKSAIKNFNQHNSVLKQKLIDDAEQLLSDDNISKAIDSSKKLQQQWRNIGFAGLRDENKLWQEFRLVNDKIFSKRDKINAEQKELSIKMEAGFSATFEQIKSALKEENELAEYRKQLKTSIIDLDNLLADVYRNKPVNKKISSDIEAFTKKLAKESDELVIKQVQQNWQNIFSLLSEVAKKGDSTFVLEDNAAFKPLSPLWKKQFKSQLTNTNLIIEDSRLEQTIAIEILAKVESPSEDTKRRMAVQVKLLQNQMVSGVEVELENELVTWLKLGKLTDKDLDLIARLEKVFVK